MESVLYLTTFFLVFLSHCYIEKTHYTGGYHVQSFKVNWLKVGLDRRSTEMILDPANKNQDTILISQIWKLSKSMLAMRLKLIPITRSWSQLELFL